MREDMREYKTLIELVDEHYLQDVSIGKDAKGVCYIQSNRTHNTTPIREDEFEFLRSSSVVKVVQET